MSAAVAPGFPDEKTAPGIPQARFDDVVISNEAGDLVHEIRVVAAADVPAADRPGGDPQAPLGQGQRLAVLGAERTSQFRPSASVRSFCQAACPPRTGRTPAAH
jgi:hypothetical protein